MPTFDSKRLIQWFESQKRDLPWRVNHSPYAVWVSEVMLQQTQVAVVIPYFNRWMALFPTVAKLADSPLETVLKAWEGLGYYSRAKNLHSGALTVMREFQGIVPKAPEELAKIKGLGPYTIGAIRAFAFHEKAAAVDGNVIRVLARYFAIEDDVSKPATLKAIWKLAEEILPDSKPWVVTEALIELGATVCKKKPNCSECPLNQTCHGLKRGLEAELPLKSAKKPVTLLYRSAAVILAEGKFLLRKVPEGEIMAGLHEFPYFESEEPIENADDLVASIKQQFQLQATPILKLKEIRHGFTRYSVRLTPYVLQCRKLTETEGYFWVSKKTAATLPFSSGHRRLLDALKAI